MKLDDFKNMVETRLKSESGNATEKSFLLEAYNIAEELKEIKQADDKEKPNQTEAKTNKADYNAVEPKVATIFDCAKILRKFCQNEKGFICEDCPLNSKNNGIGYSCDSFLAKYPDKANKTILKYLDEHSTKTYRQDFFEKHPNARTLDSGYPAVCVSHLYGNSNFSCENGCKKCWDKEYKDV